VHVLYIVHTGQEYPHRRHGAAKPPLRSLNRLPELIEIHQFVRIHVTGAHRPTIDATTFLRDFGRYHDETRREAAKITSHSRVIGGILSSHRLIRYERPQRREREVYTATDLPDDILEAIEQAEYLKPPA
jgi:hypothetical protein